MRLSQAFKGVGVALVTPFKNYHIDYESLANVLEHTIQGGVDFLVVMGTTGEASTLSPAEHFEVFDFIIEKTAGRVPIVAGFGGNDTFAITKHIKDYHFHGISAILTSSPAYNKPSQEGIYQHYMKIAEAAPCPIIIYNVPSRTSSNVEAETTLRLANSSEQFIAIKEASSNLMQPCQIIKERPKGFLVLSGDDTLTLPLLACGGDGVISVIANALPTDFVGMVNAALRYDYRLAQELNMKLLDVHKWLYIDGNPSGVKAALEILGLCGKETRLPLVPIGDKNYVQLKRELEKIASVTTNPTRASS